MTQQGDVLLSQTVDDGEINIENGLVEMSSGLETAAYLSMFGGDEDLGEWWGNLEETEPARKYRSETQNLLQSIPATSGNLRRIEQAATRDLAWFLEVKAASSVEVSASIPSINHVSITVVIEAEGVQSEFNFVENWEATK